MLAKSTAANVYRATTGDSLPHTRLDPAEDPAESEISFVQARNLLKYRYPPSQNR
jgi:hypothetical protein